MELVFRKNIIEEIEKYKQIVEHYENRPVCLKITDTLIGLGSYLKMMSWDYYFNKPLYERKNKFMRLTELIQEKI